jgi:hypothetical protein
MLQETLQLIQKFDWIINPLTDFLVFLFTTKIGLIIFSVAAFIYLIGSVGNAMLIRRLLYLASRSSYGSSKIPYGERLYIIISIFGKIIGNMILRIPVLIGVLLILLLLTKFSVEFRAFDSYVEKQKQHHDKIITLKHLHQPAQIAEISVKGIQYLSYNELETTLQVDFFDFSGNIVSDYSQQITLKGNNIYIDSKTLDFSLTEFPENGVRALTVPVRLYSSVTPDSLNIMLKSFDKNHVPHIYKRTDSKIFGIEPEQYNQIRDSICHYFKNTELARNAGVKISSGNTVNARMRMNDKFRLAVDKNNRLILENISPSQFRE